MVHLLPQLATLQAKELIKPTARLYGERNQYVKTPVKQKQQETQTDSKHTQVMLRAESEFVENVGECLDVIIPEKYTISNFNETSEI